MAKQGLVNRVSLPASINDCHLPLNQHALFLIISFQLKTNAHITYKEHQKVTRIKIVKVLCCNLKSKVSPGLSNRNKPKISLFCVKMLIARSWRQTHSKNKLHSFSIARGDRFEKVFGVQDQLLKLLNIWAP